MERKTKVSGGGFSHWFRKVPGARPWPHFLLAVLLPATSTMAGCGRETDHVGPTVRDSAGIAIVENSAPLWAEGEGWKLSELPVLDIGVMEGEPENQFFQMAGAVLLRDGRLAVANSSSGEIRFFDESGRFLRATGGKGSGPGEFEGIFFLQRTLGDSLIAYDWQTRRVSVLSSDGDFARSFEFTVLTTSGGFPILTEPFPDGDLLLATDMFLASGETAEGARRDSAVYYIVDPSGATTTPLGSFPGGESYQVINGDTWVGGGLVFGKVGNAAVSGSGFYYGSSDRWEIEYRKKDGALERILRLDRPNLPVTQGDIDRYITDRLARARPERRQVEETMFENMPFPEIMPAYADFHVDEDGNLWVGEYRRPGDDQPRWFVFDPEGALLGTVQTPPRFRIFEIGSDYVLGRWADDMDVEHVRLYELIKG